MANYVKVFAAFGLHRALLIMLGLGLLLIVVLDGVIPAEANPEDMHVNWELHDIKVTPDILEEREPSIAVSPISSDTFLVGMNAFEVTTLQQKMAAYLSVDGGERWQGGVLPNFNSGNGQLQADPVAGFDADGRAYIAGVSLNGYVCDGERQVIPPPGGIFVMSGSIAGAAVDWEEPVFVDFHVPGQFHDKPWFAIDTSTSSPFKNRIYVAWKTVIDDGDVRRTEIWFSFSTDGGKTFPISNFEKLAPDSGDGVTGAYIAIGPAGDVYIAWIEGRALYLRHSSNGGETFGQKSIIRDNINVPGDLGPSACGGQTRLLNGDIRINFYPSVAADPTNINRVYVVWNEDNEEDDKSDIYLSISNDKGSSWSEEPIIVNNDSTNDQFMPSVTVDEVGTVFVEWYDRRADRDNNLRFVPFGAFSRDAGLTFDQEALKEGLGFTNKVVIDGTTLSSIDDYLQITARPGGGAVGVWAGDGDIHVSVAEYVPTQAVDVYLLVDLSGSFTDDLPVFKAQAPGIISTLRATFPDIRFGLGKFEDYPISPFGDAGCGDKAYERLVDLTFDTDLVLNTISGLFTRCGADGPQSQLPALFQAASGDGQDLSGVGFPGASIPPGQQANFRDGATKLFILWTDAPFHLPGDPGTVPYPGPSFSETVAAILALDPPKVIGISSGGGGVADLQTVAAATGAFAPAGGTDCNADGIIDIAEGEPLVCTIAFSGEGIAEAITALVEAAAGPREVAIDIKPEGKPNSINCNNEKAIIPVAILTNGDFDTTTVDHTTVTFEGASETHVDKKTGEPRRHEEDVDGDGDIDLIFHFRLGDTNLTCDSTDGTLTGETFDGQAIQGTDMVRMVEGGNP